MNTTEIKQLAPKVVEVLAKEIAVQAKSATSNNPLSLKKIKDDFVKELLNEVNKILPDK